jgi:cell division transport system permease protein
MSARWRYILQEALVGLRRNLWMTTAVILSVTVSLALFGASILLREQVDLAAGEWTGKIEVSIYLCDGATCPAITDGQRESLEQQLRDNPLVAQVFYESKQDAYQLFLERFKDQPDLIETVSPDALPASFRVKLRDPEQFGAIKEQYDAVAGVEDIVDQRELLEEFLKFARTIRWSAFVIAVIQMLAATVLVANTVRVAAFARREQTQIMKLVGASNWYIRLPFVMEGILAGLAGAAVAWGLLLASVPRLMDSLRADIEFVPFIGMTETAAVWPWLFIPAVIIAATSSLIALWGFLDV